MPRLARRFFARPSDELARALLGQRLVKITLDGERLAGTIVETEAYLAPEDDASHAYNHRRTARTEPMYGPPGTAYVYFTYGMHFCMNVSAAARDVPHAVLIRALEPVEGLDTMSANRGPGARRARDLCSGPGKLCRALGIGRAHSGIDLCESGELFLERGRAISDADVGVGPRIGLRPGGVWTEKPLRWLVLGNPHVSRGLRAQVSGHSA